MIRTTLRELNPRLSGVSGQSHKPARLNDCYEIVRAFPIQGDFVAWSTSTTLAYCRTEVNRMNHDIE